MLLKYLYLYLIVLFLMQVTQRSILLLLSPLPFTCTIMKHVVPKPKYMTKKNTMKQDGPIICQILILKTMVLLVIVSNVCEAFNKNSYAFNMHDIKFI